MLPLELLREKYIPITEYPERFNISVDIVMKLIDENRVHKAEFKAPGAYKRSLHANYEEVLALVNGEDTI